MPPLFPLEITDGDLKSQVLFATQCPNPYLRWHDHRLDTHMLTHTPSRNRFTRTVIAALSLGFVSSANAQYRDSYPKNADIDMLGYVFTLTFSDESDTVQGTTTVTARYLAAGHSELRLDLIQVSEELDGKGMTVTRVALRKD